MGGYLGERPSPTCTCVHPPGWECGRGTSPPTNLRFKVCVTMATPLGIYNTRLPSVWRTAACAVSGRENLGCVRAGPNFGKAPPAGVPTHTARVATHRCLWANSHSCQAHFLPEDTPMAAPPGPSVATHTQKHTCRSPGPPAPPASEDLAPPHT